MEEAVLMNSIYPLGQTGIYLNVEQMANRFKNWIENTPNHIKKRQIENIATTGFLLSVGLLFVLSLSK